jgi:hypothetical protein
MNTKLNYRCKFRNITNPPVLGSISKRCLPLLIKFLPRILCRLLPLRQHHLYINTCNAVKRHSNWIPVVASQSYLTLICWNAVSVIRYARGLLCNHTLCFHATYSIREQSVLSRVWSSQPNLWVADNYLAHCLYQDSLFAGNNNPMDI